MTNRKQEALDLATAKFGAQGEFSNQDMLGFGSKLEKQGFARADYNWLFKPEYKIQRGLYKLPTVAPTGKVSKETSKTPKAAKVTAPVSVPQPQMVATEHIEKFKPNATSEFSHAVIPDRDKHYTPFGDFKDIEAIIKSGTFFPVFIAGMSGNGKTFMVEQACARTKRAMVRVQMTRETDEDDLIGGFRLINGETKFMKGPVLMAMELGAVLLIDEADRADPGKVMCLQGILEGKPYYVKKTGEVLRPAEGFNVFVTANTKGKGSDDGRYVAAGVLDDAWLERYPITIEQSYPSAKTEARILRNYMADGGREVSDADNAFITNLISWSDIIRKTFDDGAIDELISTRRLVHIVQTYKMFDNNRMRAIQLCINRFDSESRNTFLELYTKVDADVATPTPGDDAESNEASADDVPF